MRIMTGGNRSRVTIKNLTLKNRNMTYGTQKIRTKKTKIRTNTRWITKKRNATPLMRQRTTATIKMRTIKATTNDIGHMTRCR